MTAEMMIIIMIYKTWVENLFQSVHLSRFSRQPMDHHHTQPHGLLQTRVQQDPRGKDSGTGSWLESVGEEWEDAKEAARMRKDEHPEMLLHKFSPARYLNEGWNRMWCTLCEEPAGIRSGFKIIEQQSLLSRWMHFLRWWFASCQHSDRLFPAAKKVLPSVLCGFHQRN